MPLVPTIPPAEPIDGVNADSSVVSPAEKSCVASRVVPSQRQKKVKAIVSYLGPKLSLLSTEAPILQGPEVPLPRMLRTSIPALIKGLPVLGVMLLLAMSTKLGEPVTT